MKNQEKPYVFFEKKTANLILVNILDLGSFAEKSNKRKKQKDHKVRSPEIYFYIKETTEVKLN